MREWIIFFLLICIAKPVYSQTEIGLAREYLNQKECEKATIPLLKALNQNFEPLLLKEYTQCLLGGKNIGKSESWIRKNILPLKNYEAWAHFYLGVILKAQNKISESQKHFNKVLEQINTERLSPTEFIGLFQEYNLPEYATKVISNVRVQLGNPNILHLEMAALAQEVGDNELMVREIVKHIAFLRNKDLIQSTMNEYLKTDEQLEIFERVIYEYIQNNPNQAVYNEILITHLIQKRDFYRAFLQERALDKRLQLQGGRLLELAQFALNSEDYTSAVAMYQYLLKEYANAQFTPFVKRMAIFSKEKKIKSEVPTKIIEVESLITEYEILIKELGSNHEVLEAMRSVAALEAFYLKKREKAIKRLEQAIELGKHNTNFVSKAKLDLGDIYVLENDMWEASLLYSQVEKAQKDTPIGHEAKLRNAKVHYYAGNFDLAKSILDVLKKATSREIANDANALGLLIMDNTGLDSSEDALKAYSKIELMLFQNQLNDATNALDNLYMELETHSLADEILWLQAQTFIRLDQYDQAVQKLTLLLEKFSYDVLGDDAAYTLAVLHQEKLGNKEEAQRLFTQFITTYPGSIFVADVRKRIRMLRGEVLP